RFTRDLAITTRGGWLRSNAPAGDLSNGLSIIGLLARRISRTDHPRRESMLRTTLLVLPLLLTGNAVADAQAVGHRVKVNGMQMYYEVSGRGDPLIVLHGAYMNIPMMGAIVPKLAASHRVYALE